MVDSAHCGKGVDRLLRALQSVGALPAAQLQRTAAVGQARRDHLVALRRELTASVALVHARGVLARWVHASGSPTRPRLLPSAGDLVGGSCRARRVTALPQASPWEGRERGAPT